MTHKTASSFWKCYEYLPVDIRDLADKNFLLLRNNPSHPSLQFKKVGKVWSVRVGSNYRAIATQIEEGYLWIWIGCNLNIIQLLDSNRKPILIELVPKLFPTSRS